MLIWNLLRIFCFVLKGHDAVRSGVYAEHLCRGPRLAGKRLCVSICSESICALQDEGFALLTIGASFEACVVKVADEPGARVEGWQVELS